MGSASSGGGGSRGGFDLSDLSEAARRFEVELHGPSSLMRPSVENVGSIGSVGSVGSVGGSVDKENAPHLTHAVDPHRPLASEGTTIKSGSGNDVNVFEDFGMPTEDDQSSGANDGQDEAGIKSGHEESASSRLMGMIGVKPGGSGENETESNEVGSQLLSSLSVGVVSAVGETEKSDPPTPSVDSSVESSAVGATITVPSTSSIPRNPWGDTILPAASSLPEQSGTGMNLSARLEAALAEQKAREAAAKEAVEAEDMRRREEAELIRLRQEEEEKQRQATMRAQREAEEQAARVAVQQRAMQAQQQQQAAAASGHSQVELILMERISAILENSWGRSDLLSILHTLHAEDSRVIPLLGSVDALRALVVRHPRRIQLVNDPAFGAEMAVLAMTNAQWQQQQQQQEAQMRAQQEEMKRHQRQRQQEEEEQRRVQQQMQAAARAQAEAEERANSVAPQSPLQISEAPWYYADPQGNIQVGYHLLFDSFTFLDFINIQLATAGSVPQLTHLSLSCHLT